jgi:hypothetical protein
MADRRRRRVARRGVSPALARLAARGERIRYHGFTLNDSTRDRAVAEWIDSYEGDVAEWIKDKIYEEATGEIPAQEMSELVDLVQSIHSMLSSGRLVAAPGAEEEVQGTASEVAAAERAFGRFGT